MAIETGSEGEAEFKTLATKAGAEAINNGKIENIALTFEKQEKQNFNVLFKAKKTSLGYIEIKIKKAEEEIFSKTIWLDATASKEITLEIMPEKIPLLKEQEIIVKASAQNSPVADAQIRMATILADNSRTVQNASTNENGVTKFLLPKTMPGTRLLFEAEKEDYYSEQIEKTIETSVFSVSPEIRG